MSRAVKQDVSAPEEVRALSRIFSTTYLAKLIDQKSRPDALERLRWIQATYGLGYEPVSIILSRAYETLVEKYRNEHVFKEAVTQWWINRSGNRSSVGMVFELRSGVSKLDVLCGIGLSHALEIKTDFDQPTRLARQLCAYYERFPRVSLVVSNRSVAKFESSLAPEVGIISVSERGSASVYRVPVARFDSLSKSSMISLLRRSELLSLGAWFGCDMSSVPNTRLRLELLKCVATVERAALSDHIARLIGRRSNRIDVASIRELPRGIRSLVVKLDLSGEQYSELKSVLAIAL